MGWEAAALAAVLAVVPALWLRTRRYRRSDDEGQRTLSPWVLPPAAAMLTLLALPFDGGVPLVVAGTGVLALVWGLTCAFVDLEVRRLPDVLTLPAYPAAAVLLTLASFLEGDWSALLRAAAAAGTAVAAFLLLALLSLLVSPGGSGLGLGDVKLAGVLAGLLAWSSWTAAVFGLLAGFAIGALVAAVLLLTRRAGRRSSFSYGPSLLAGAYLAALLLTGSPR